MKDLDAIREDVEIEMAKEIASCRGDVYAEKEALWLALRDERVTKSCIVSDMKKLQALKQEDIEYIRKALQVAYREIQVAHCTGELQAVCICVDCQTVRGALAKVSPWLQQPRKWRSYNRSIPAWTCPNW